MLSGKLQCIQLDLHGSLFQHCYSQRQDAAGVHQSFFAFYWFYKV